MRWHRAGGRAHGVTGMVLLAALTPGLALIVTACGDTAASGTATGQGTAAPRSTGATSVAAEPAPERSGRTYADPRGDVTPGQPDLTAVRISSDATTVRLVFRFADAPPLSTNTKQGWTDMLLFGIDAPPIGSAPTPNGWAGLDYALGMHGVDNRAVFRAMQPGFGDDGGVGGAPGVRTLTSRVSGREIHVDLPRELIGNPTYFAFQAAAGREGADESGTGDLMPGTGTLRYPLNGGGN